VDEGIVSADMHDFYLVPSIAPPRASARPTRTFTLGELSWKLMSDVFTKLCYVCICILAGFIVVRDELELSSDDVELLTNAYCMGYQNWRKCFDCFDFFDCFDVWGFCIDQRDRFVCRRRSCTRTKLPITLANT
jgi:hypothetical protein